MGIINNDFYLSNETAKKLYHDFAENLPMAMPVKKVIQALKPDVKNAWYMLFFLRYLYEVHGIQYVRIESVPHRYDFFLKFSASAKYDSVVNLYGEPREVIYLDIKKDLPGIKKLLYR